MEPQTHPPEPLQPEAGLASDIEAVLRAQDTRRAEENARPPAKLEHQYQWLERKQRLLFYPLVAGVLLWPVLGPRVGLSITGGAVLLAGAVPFVTGRYRTRFMRMYGLPARLRGLFSMAMGAVVILAAFSL